MAGPATIEDYQASNWTDIVGTSEVTPSITWLSGDMVVVVGMTEDSGRTFGTPTATGLTFSSVSSVGGASNALVQMWTATAGADGSSAVTATITGVTTNDMRGIAAIVVRSHNGVGTPQTITGSTAKTISLTTVDTSSVVIAVFGDWNAVNDTAVNATPSSGGTVRQASYVSGRATGFCVTWTGQGAATTSYGITDHTGTVDMNGIVIEIKGTAAGGGATCGMPFGNRSTAFNGGKALQGSAFRRSDYGEDVRLSRRQQLRQREYREWLRSQGAKA